MKTSFSLLLLFLLSVSACGGRIPSDAKTARLSENYFHSYGKKYPTSLLGQNRVVSAQVDGTQELQKNLATSRVQLTLQDQSQHTVLITLLRKFPMGWRIKGWEVFGASGSAIPQPEAIPPGEATP